MWILPNNQIISVPQNVVIDDIQHPQTIFNLWSKEELLAVGIRTYHAANPPEGYRVIASRTEVIDDDVHEVVDVMPVEPPPYVTPVEEPIVETPEEPTEEPSATTP
jgi:hypothetical protein